MHVNNCYRSCNVMVVTHLACFRHICVFHVKMKKRQYAMPIRYPRRVTVNNKRLISKCKKSEKKYAYLQKPWHYLELQKEITLIALALRF